MGFHAHAQRNFSVPLGGKKILSLGGDDRDSQDRRYENHQGRTLRGRVHGFGQENWRDQCHGRLGKW